MTEEHGGDEVEPSLSGVGRVSAPAQTDEMASTCEHEPDRSEPAELIELRELLALAKEGDQSALPRLREILDGHPEVWGWYGDLAMHVQSAYIGLVTGTDLGLAEALRRKVASLKDELSGPVPTPIERLLAERVASCWLQLQWAEATIARPCNVSVKQAGFALRQQNSAHRRYMTALGALATVQRLLPAAKQPAPLANSHAAPPQFGDTCDDPTKQAGDIRQPRPAIRPLKDRAGRASRHADLSLFAAGDAATNPDCSHRATTVPIPPEAC
jgi:hypothetical protein